MQLIYNIGITIAAFVLKCIALFNKKIKLGVLGRRQVFKVLEHLVKEDCKTLWFHCASLGEYEQGLPVFQELKKHYTKHKIVLSFFSPSGYEIRKNTPLADAVVYLPMDTKVNSKRFLDLVNPELTVFVKYDIWPNIVLELKKRNLRAILISAAFRKNQIYFKPYGGLFKKALFTFEHIFTQNQSSKVLLNGINYKSVSVSGDTRFDRVSNQLLIDNKLDFVEAFKGDNLCVVAGSTWPEDEVLFINFINSKVLENVKFIVAPHNIKPNQIKSFAEKLNIKTVLFSERNNKQLKDYNVLIVDTIGLLSKIYSYADIAYVGGAMGTTGLHNTLEPAVFGVPVIVGKNHRGFPEAQEMINYGGMFSIQNQDRFNTTLNKLISDNIYRTQCGTKSASFIKENKGAVLKIIDYLKI